MKLPELLDQYGARCGASIHARRALYRVSSQLLSPRLNVSARQLARVRPFLISSTGRTGTMWLSHLLNMACDALVVHEPLPAETIDHRRALEEPHSPAVEAHAGFRIRDMVRRLEHSGKARYGEVCPPLRRHVQHLRRLCPEIQCFHLIRDGRAVVMSMMNRATLTEHDKVYCGFYPSEDLVSRTRWRSMDRFARICWLWAQENAFLREHCSRTVRFEDITRSFALFREQLLLPLDIEITESLWASSVAKRMNETLSPRLTADSWSSRQEQHFDEICGAEMRNAGYIE